MEALVIILLISQWFQSRRERKRREGLKLHIDAYRDIIERHQKAIEQQLHLTHRQHQYIQGIKQRHLN